MTENKRRQLEYSLRGSEFTLIDVLDVVIEMNGIIGVGLISLENALSKHIRGKIRDPRGKGASKAELTMVRDDLRKRLEFDNFATQEDAEHARATVHETSIILENQVGAM